MPLSYRYSQYFPFILLLFDLVCLNISLLMANQYYYGFLVPTSDYRFLQLLLNVIWIGVFFVSKLQEVDRSSELLVHLNKILTGLAINLSIVFALWFIFQSEDHLRKFLFITYLCFTLTVLSWRSFWHYFIRYYRAKGYNYRNVLIIGEGDLPDALGKHIEENSFLGFRLVESVKSYDLAEICQLSKDRGVNIIFCYLSSFSEDQVRDIINFAENNLIKVNFFSHFSKFKGYNLSMQRLGDIPFIRVNTMPLDNILNKFIKRSFDIAFSCLVFIVILSWLIPIIALVIKIESKGPVFFKQDRHGYNNRFFSIYKIRTMYVHNDRNVEQAKKGDSRITRIGAILRRTSADELPQFINVLKGEMSVVGPRPHAIQHNTDYQPKIDRFWQRHSVKPGITGLAQTKGFRGETAKLSDMSSRIKLDRFYIKNWSLILDLRIIILTIIAVLKGDRNAY
ncbi:MAG: undecaprenyl-phosphate glucose phosphotransferase [Ekhidna sp.]|nr:undecaprenyl-phosphate glucose phosphotransferase [Ekhidna sp.]